MLLGSLQVSKLFQSCKSSQEAFWTEPTCTGAKMLPEDLKKLNTVGLKAHTPYSCALSVKWQIWFFNWLKQYFSLSAGILDFVILHIL